MNRWIFILLATLSFLILLDSFLGNFILPVPFEVSFILTVLLTWGLAPFILSKIKKGLRIYFINLISSLILCGGAYLISAPLKNNPNDWKSNLAGIEMLVVSLVIWILWGWILVIFAGIKRFR